MKRVWSQPSGKRQRRGLNIVAGFFLVGFMLLSAGCFVYPYDYDYHHDGYRHYHGYGDRYYSHGYRNRYYRDRYYGDRYYRNYRD